MSRLEIVKNTIDYLDELKDADLPIPNNMIDWFKVRLLVESKFEREMKK